MRHDRNRGDEPQFRRLGRDEGHRGQLFVAVAAGPARELAGIGIGVFLLQFARDHDMVAERAVVVADRLAFGGDLGEVPRPR